MGKKRKAFVPIKVNFGDGPAAHGQRGKRCHKLLDLCIRHRVIFLLILDQKSAPYTQELM